MPLAVPLLVLIHFAAFGIIMLVLLTQGPDPVVRLFADFGLVPSQVRWFTPLTYGLIHENALHVSVNMGLLWVFGAPVEQVLGRARFVGAYAVAVALTGLLQAAVASLAGGSERTFPILGASGAVAAIAGVFAVRFYRSRVKLVWIRPLHVPALGLLGLLLGAEMGLAGWHVFRGDIALSAHWSHIGGFLLGLLYGQLARLHRSGEQDYLARDAARALERGAPLSAVRRLEALREAQPGDPEIVAGLARAWALAGDREQAVGLYRQAIECFLQSGNKRDAVACRGELAKLSPEDLLGEQEEFAVACALDEQGRGDECVAAYRRFLAAFPGSSQEEMASLRLGLALLRRANRPQEARAALEAFLDRHPESAHRDYALAALKETM